MSSRRGWRRSGLILALAIAAVLTLGFAGRATYLAVYWSDPAHREQEIAGWMTPRYVAMSWDVPPEVIAAALELERDGTGRRITLEALADARGTTPEALAERLRTSIEAYRTAR